MIAQNANLPATNERNGLLDALRGFALFGIMFVNITWFSGYAVLSAEQRSALGTESVDTIVAWLVHVAVDSKFWSLFALLFGLGFAIQLERATRRSQNFTPLYLRRMSILLAFGMVHAVFIWFGDILGIYALCGVALLLFRKTSPRRLLVWAIVLLMSPIFVNGVWLLVDASVRSADMPRIDPGHGPGHMLVNFSDGTYAEVIEANWAFLTERWVIAAYTARFLTVLGMFMLGFYAGLRGIIRNPQRHVPLLRRTLIWGLVIGLPANILLATIHVPLRPPSVSGWLMFVVGSIGIPALSLSYASGFVLLFQRPLARRLLAPFASVGRMSLTSYLTQSVVGVALFYGCGLGLWGAFGITIAVGYLIVFFGLQSVASAWWLHYFNYGPLEWAWRCLTYRQVLPIRRPVPPIGVVHSPSDSIS